MASPATRARDIKPPKPLNDEDFEAICGTFKIDKIYTEGLRKFLFNFVETFADLIESKRLSPDLPTDRDSLQEALRSIRGSSEKYAEEDRTGWT